MIYSKAIDVLKTFTNEELKQFSDFVRSPFFNKNKNLIKLFDLLKKYHPEYELAERRIDKQNELHIPIMLAVRSDYNMNFFSTTYIMTCMKLLQ